MYCSLNDNDDDVKSVAASCLLPVAEHIVQQLPERLSQILLVLWNCLSNMKDDLGSSVGVVMDLLSTYNLEYRLCYMLMTFIEAKLVAHDKVIEILAGDKISYDLKKIFVHACCS